MNVSAAEEGPLSTPAPSAPASPFRAPGFRRYWLSQLCAIFASQMQGVAIGWQVYDMTQRPLDLGFVGLAQFLPVCMLALAAGQAADRYDRRRIFVGCLGLEIICALLLLMLTLVGNREVLWIFAVLALAGVARAFQFPATAALLPNLVPTPQFASADGMDSPWEVSVTI